jgi:hypothetical protein
MAATSTMKVANQSKDMVKILLEYDGGAKLEEITLAGGHEKDVPMKSLHGVISVAFCEAEGVRFALLIFKKRERVQAGNTVTITPFDRHHPGIYRYERVLPNARDLVRGFSKMSLAEAVTQTLPDGSSQVEHPPAQDYRPSDTSLSAHALPRIAGCPGLNQVQHPQPREYYPSCARLSAYALPPIPSADVSPAVVPGLSQGQIFRMQSMPFLR